MIDQNAGTMFMATFRPAGSLTWRDPAGVIYKSDLFHPNNVFKKYIYGSEKNGKKESLRTRNNWWSLDNKLRRPQEAKTRDLLWFHAMSVVREKRLELKSIYLAWGHTCALWFRSKRGNRSTRSLARIDHWMEIVCFVVLLLASTVSLEMKRGRDNQYRDQDS